jgi:hypothetical protein
MAKHDRVGFICDHELQVLQSHFEVAQRAPVDVIDARSAQKLRARCLLKIGGFFSGVRKCVSAVHIANGIANRTTFMQTAQP